MTTRLDRRRFLAAGAAALLAPSAAARALRRPAARDKLSVGVIGVANRGRANLNAVAGENVVALCDVDRGYLDEAAARFPGAKIFRDYREMLQLDGLDAVVISTPDHHHAPAAARALRRKLHVYCEKPLTHTLEEARLLVRLARESGCVTQMGTQIHAHDNYRRVVELVQTGAIGPIEQVHVFCDKTWSGGDRPEDTPPVPEGLDFDLWLGPAPARPYHPTYHPAGWRRFWDFGGGTIADMACHYLDLAYWALDLTLPEAIEASGPAVHAETTPEELTVRYRFPAHAGRPAVDVAWYDGTARPEPLAELGLGAWKNGVLFIGKKGWLISDYGRHVLGPESDFKGFEPPPRFLPRSIGHHAEWIAACKHGGSTSCDFAYAGRLTETVLAGNVAYRRGEKIAWSATRLEGPLVSKEYRKGFEIEEGS